MTGGPGAFVANARWEVTRWRRSRRGWLLAIPPVAGPIGSAVADLYLRIPSVATAEILGLLITGGLGGLVVLDLAALSIGEELGTREYLVTMSLPQSRTAAIAGRLAPAMLGPLASYLLGAGAIFVVAPVTVSPSAVAAAPLFVPSHLLLALLALLVFLGGISAAAATFTRSAAQGLVAGVLAGVVVAAGVGLMIFQRDISWLAPALLAVGGVAALIYAAAAYAMLDG